MIVGLDMGGTHIDAIIMQDGKVIKVVKKPTDYDDLFHSIWTTLKELLQGIDQSMIKKINLSTTISTNAIVENKTANVGMIIQSGPGLPNEHLAVGNKNVFINGYTDHRGEIVRDVNTKEIDEAIALFSNTKIEDVAIVTKFSTRNPTGELEIAKLVSKHIQRITLGHKTSGKLNFPRRVNTAYLNAAVYDTFSRFLDNIKLSFEKEGIQAPVSILKADGGIMSIDAAKDMPVETILSGPAASLMGIQALLDTNKDAVLLDIGGTTTDIFFLADGVPLFEPAGIKIDKYKTLVRSIYSVSIGLGGDSSITVEDKKLKIGPQRQGKPFACGGPVATPTDAMIVLGKLDIGDRALAKEALSQLATNSGLSIDEVANEILDTMARMIKGKVNELLTEINSKPVYTVEELLHGKKLVPQSISMIGGPAKALAPRLEKEFNVPCHYPQYYEVANAIGAALAKITTEINLIADTSRGTLSVPELGVYEKINRHYSFSAARERALELVAERATSMGAEQADLVTEIIEESVFNMVDGFTTKGQNIRIKAQVKPGLIHKLKGEQHA
ncbi:MAG: hydantoinase/oxoprolinase family protein [Kiritimatiellae bacterium]|nr:hydantoinase/oxoprolinase family protein [Kiritimatiellia bacterium]